MLAIINYKAIWSTCVYRIELMRSGTVRVSKSQREREKVCLCRDCHSQSLISKSYGKLPHYRASRGGTQTRVICGSSFKEYIKVQEVEDNH